MIAAVIGVAACGALFAYRILAPAPGAPEGATETATAEQLKTPDSFRPTAAQLVSFAVTPVKERSFRPEGLTEGKIAINEDRNTPIFTPYAGRVIRILARAGDDVAADQVLFTIEATDMVSALNDHQAALNALKKADALAKLNQLIATRQQDLFQARAVALKDWQAAQNDLVAAQADLRTAQTAVLATRNRLRILGKTDAEIDGFETSGTISPETPIKAPLAGTIVQRKVGPGQYLQSSSDPPFVIGDVSTVWLVASVRESIATQVKVGQQLEVSVLAVPGRIFTARITYIGASVDPATRRLQVRAEIENPGRILKPEMFASFGIVTGDTVTSPALPRDAVVYEGSSAHVWTVQPDGSVASRDVRLGLTNGDDVQVLDGVAAGDRIVTRGSLFLDRAANGDKS